MTTTDWLAMILAIGSLLTVVYFGADLAVLMRGPDRVPPGVLRLARAGDRHVRKGTLAEIAMASGAALFFQAVIVAWLVIRFQELDSVARLFLISELLMASSLAFVLWQYVRSSSTVSSRPRSATKAPPAGRTFFRRVWQSPGDGLPAIGLSRDWGRGA